jgi:hypothetical protein
MAKSRGAPTVATLEHDPKKWKPVLPRDKRENAFARRSCSGAVEFLLRKTIQTGARFRTSPAPNNLHHAQLDFDVAARGAGIWADLFVGDPGQLLDLAMVVVRHRDLKLDGKFKEAFIVASDRDMRRNAGFANRLLALARNAQQRILEARGIAGCEELLRVRRSAARSTQLLGIGELVIENAIG